MSFISHWIHVKKFAILRGLLTKSFWDLKTSEGKKDCTKCIHAKLVTTGFYIADNGAGNVTVHSSHDFLCRGFGHNTIIGIKPIGMNKKAFVFDGQKFPGSSQSSETIWMYPFAKDMNPTGDCMMGVHLPVLFRLPRMMKMRRTKRHLTLA